MAELLSIQEFSEKIKNKYPQYKDIDDEELVSKMLDKYPQYKNQIDIKKKEPSVVSSKESLTQESKSYTRETPQSGFRTVAEFGAPKDVKPKTETIDLVKEEEELKKKQQADKDQEKKYFDYLKAEYTPIINKNLDFIRAESDKIKTMPDYYTGMKEGEMPSDIAGLTRTRVNQLQNYKIAKNTLKTAQKFIDTADEEGLKAFVSGLKNKSSIDFLTLGFNELFDNVNMAAAAERYREGRATGEDELALTSKAMLNELKSAKPSDMGYNVGATLAEAIPYLTQIALTRGVGSSAKEAVKKTLKGKMKNNLGGKVIQEAAGAAAQAPLFWDMWSGAAEKATGDVTMEEGEVKITGEKGTGKAIAESYMNTFAEVFPERLGGLFRLGKGSKKPISTLGNKIKKTFKWDGLPSEFAEEQLTTVIQAVTTGDASMSDLLDMEKQFETLVSVAAMGGAFKAMEIPGYVKGKLNDKKIKGLESELSEAVGSGFVSDIDEAIKNGNPDRMRTKLSELGIEALPSNMQGKVVDYISSKLEQSAADSVVEQQEEVVEEETKPKPKPDVEVQAEKETIMTPKEGEIEAKEEKVGIKTTKVPEKVLRVGKIEGDKAHFAISEKNAIVEGAMSQDPETVREYKIKEEAKIADINDKETLDAIKAKALDQAKTEEEKDFINKFDPKERPGDYEYSKPIEEAAKALGYDGMTQFDIDMEESPTAVNIWNMDVVEGEEAKAEPKAETEREEVKKVIEESKDPEEIKRVYQSEAVKTKAVQPWQGDLLSRKISRDSFIENDDKANITQGMAKSWLRKDGEKLDVLASELSKEYNVEVTERDIVDFIKENPDAYIRKYSKEQEELAVKYKELTGLSLKSELSKKDQDDMGEFFNENAPNAFTYEDQLEALEQHKDKLTGSQYEKFKNEIEESRFQSELFDDAFMEGEEIEITQEPTKKEKGEIDYAKEQPRGTLRVPSKKEREVEGKRDKDVPEVDRPKLQDRKKVKEKEVADYRTWAQEVSQPEFTLEYEVMGKDLEQAEKKAKREQRIESSDMIKDLRDHIKGLSIKSKLKKRQVGQIATQVKNAVKSGSFRAIEKAKENITKIYKDAGYIDKLSFAKKKQKAIRKKAKSKNNFGSTYNQEALKFSSIPVSKLSPEELDRYMDIADKLVRKVPREAGLVAFNEEFSSLAEGITKEVDAFESIKKMEDIIDELNRADIKSPDEYRKAIRKARAVENKIQKISSQTVFDRETAERLSSKLEELDSRLENYASKIGDLGERIKNDLIDDAKGAESNVDYDNFDREEKIEVKKFYNIDDNTLQGMDFKDVDLYNQIAEGLEDGVINIQLYKFMDNLGAEKKYKSFKETAEKVEQKQGELKKVSDFLNKVGMKRLGQYLNPLSVVESEELARRMKLTLGSVMDSRFGLGKTNEIWNNIVSPMNELVERMDKTVSRKLKDFEKAAYKVRRKEDSRIKVGMVLAQEDYSSNPRRYKGKETQWKDLPIEKRDKMRDLIDNEVDQDDLTGKFQKYKDIWNKTPKDEDGNMDVSKVKEGFTKAEKELYNQSKKTARSLESETKSAAQSRGVVFVETKNYFPNIVRQKRVDSNVTEQDSFDKMLSNADTGRITSKTGSIEKRVGDNYIIELDVSKVIPRKTREVSRDFYLSRPLSQTMRAFNKILRESKGDQKKFISAMKDMVSDRLRADFAFKYGDSELRRVLRPLLKWTRGLALGKAWRMPIEYISNLVRYMVSKGLPNYRAGYDGIYSDIMDNENAPIYEKTSRYAESLQDMGTSRAERMLVGMISFADTQVGKVVYATEFNKSFKKQTGEKFQPKQYNNTDYRNKYKKEISKASRDALQIVSKLYNAQSGFEQPSKQKFVPLRRSKGLDKGSEGAKMLNFMQSFTFNETAHTIEALKDLALNTNEGRMKAARKISGMILSNYMYTNIMMAFGELLRASGDEDETFAEALTEHFAPENQWRAFKGSLMALMTGRYGNVLRPVIGLGLGYWKRNIEKGLMDGFGSEQEKAKRRKEALEEFEKVKKAAEYAIFTKPITANTKAEQIMAFIPAYGGAIADILDSFGDISDITNKIRDNGVESLTPDEKELWTALSFMNQLAMFTFPNPISPTAERYIKSEMYGTQVMGEQLPMDNVNIVKKIRPDKSLPKVNRKKEVYSTGTKEYVMTDKQRKGYQRKALELFNTEYSKYLETDEGKNVVSKVKVENPDVDDMEKARKDLRKVWRSAEKQARNQTLEYPYARDKKEFKLMMDLDVVPDPITIGEIKKLKENNRAFINEIMEEVGVMYNDLKNMSEEEAKYEIDQIVRIARGIHTGRIRSELTIKKMEEE